MRELTDLQLDQIFRAGFADEAEQRVQPRATAEEMTARVRAANKRRTGRRPLFLLAAALLIAGTVTAVVIGTRPPELVSQSAGPVNCVSTLPEGWRMRLNLALPGAMPDIVTLDGDGLLIRGSDNAMWESVNSWSDRARSSARQLTPAQADAMVVAVDEAFPDGFCGSIAKDPAQTTTPSIEVAGRHFVMVNGSAMQPTRVSSAQELRALNKLLATLRGLIADAETEARAFEPETFDLIVNRYPPAEGGLDAPDPSSVRPPAGYDLSTVGLPVAESTGHPDPLQPQIPDLLGSRCMTVPREDADAWAAALDASDAWSSDHAAWLFSDAAALTSVRLIERRPYQPECQDVLWPEAVVDDAAISGINQLDPCSLIRPEVTLPTFGRQVAGTPDTAYFPDADGCVYQFDVFNRAPPIVGIRRTESNEEDFQRLAEFYLGRDGLTATQTARGYQAFYNGCESSTTPTKCAAVVAYEPYLVIVYLPFTRADESEAPGVLRTLVDSIEFPEDR